MSKVFSAHAVSVDGYIAPGETHLRYEVIR
jgi:hypothetical protein